jgi:hypothetical protein
MTKVQVDDDDYLNHDDAAALAFCIMLEGTP